VWVPAPLKHTHHAKNAAIIHSAVSSAVLFRSSTFFLLDIAIPSTIMSSELPCPPSQSSDGLLTTLAPSCLAKSPLLSRTSLLDAQHTFRPLRRRHLVSRLPTRCQGRLLGRRQVRLSITTYPQPHSTQLNHLINDHRTGDETCDGLSNLARALIGLAFCTLRYHHPIDATHIITKFPRVTSTLYLLHLLTQIFFPDPNSGRTPTPQPINQSSSSSAYSSACLLIADDAAAKPI
jgi:hypothetical protein